tara:strand:- start:259 stop:561 length:303 start_codon:yes stop_codon:yes gene_type:complete
MTLMHNKKTLAKVEIEGVTYELSRVGGGLAVGHPSPGVDPKQMLHQIERDLLIRMMVENNWNKSKTAKTIGVHRHTLIGRLQAKGLHPTTEEVRGQEVLP